MSNVERACSILSLISCVFTIATFTFSKSFRKPINRLVFYASFGNMMSNVGTLMSRTYLPFPNSAGCQFQAFLIQMYAKKKKDSSSLLPTEPFLIHAPCTAGPICVTSTQWCPPFPVCAFV